MIDCDDPDCAGDPDCATGGAVCEIATKPDPADRCPADLQATDCQSTDTSLFCYPVTIEPSTETILECECRPGENACWAFLDGDDVICMNRNKGCDDPTQEMCVPVPGDRNDNGVGNGITDYRCECITFPVCEPNATGTACVDTKCKSPFALDSCNPTEIHNIGGAEKVLACACTDCYVKVDASGEVTCNTDHCSNPSTGLVDDHFCCELTETDTTGDGNPDTFECNCVDRSTQSCGVLSLTGAFLDCTGDCCNTTKECDAVWYGSGTGAVTSGYYVCNCLASGSCAVDIGPDFDPFCTGACSIAGGGCQLFGYDSDLNGEDDTFTCSCAAPPQPQACTLEDESCAFLPESVCLEVGGTPLGAGFPCPTCAVPDPPKPEPKVFPKNRYISFIPNNPGQLTSLRVRLVSAPDHPDSVGAEWWVGPPRTVCENGGQIEPPPEGCGPAPSCAPNPTMLTSDLQCTPHCRDWGSLEQVLDVGDANIVPNAVYEVEAVACDCETSPSAVLSIRTSIWGDAVAAYGGCPAGYAQPEGSVDIVTDVTALLSKFQNLKESPTKAQSDLEPEQPDRQNNISDVTFALNAFGGDSYPFSSPTRCPPPE